MISTQVPQTEKKQVDAAREPALSLIYSVITPDAQLVRKLQAIQETARSLNIEVELLLIDYLGLDRQALAADHLLTCFPADPFAYGGALTQALQQARGEFILTLDNDHAHPAEPLLALWDARQQADVVIASRYTAGGRAGMPLFRRTVSRLFNAIFSRGLDLAVRDMSSGFRIYRRSSLSPFEFLSTDFSILQEILVRVYLEGFTIQEIPFQYLPDPQETRLERLVRFGRDYVKTFYRLWKLRNSIASADYDARAYHTWLIPQRYWQRQRFRHIGELITRPGPCLDVGCGSSNIIGLLPEQSLALDILLRKLRYAKRFDRNLVNGSAFNLPVPDASFECVVCSQLIEHIPRGVVLDELDRVLKPGGRLVLGTPDYGKWQWLLIEYIYGKVLPQAYADEHITHYTYDELIREFVDQRGYRLVDSRYILQGELILALDKRGG